MKDLREHLETFQKEIPVIKQAPISFAFVSVVAFGAIWLVFHFTYGGRLDSKDATIQSVEHERDRFKTEAERLEKENGRLKQGLPATPLGSIKKQAEVLADQLSEFSIALSKTPPEGPHHGYDYFNFRFRDRIRRLRDALDEIGVHSDLLDQAPGLGDFMMLNGDNKSVATIESAAKEIRRLIKDLKE